MWQQQKGYCPVVHPPPLGHQIQSRWTKSKTRQNVYQFPRKKQSNSSSITNKSLNGYQTYNLYQQNGHLIQANEKGKDILIKPNPNTSKNSSIIKWEKQIGRRQNNKSELQIRSLTKILDLKGIKEANCKVNKERKQKIKVTQKQPVFKKIDLFKSHHRSENETDIDKKKINNASSDDLRVTTATPQRGLDYNTKNSRVKSSSKKKILVISTHQLRKISTFKQQFHTSPRRGVRVYSKQKQVGKQQGKNSIQ